MPETKPDTKERDTKEWTLMFYMASDNPLAISVVSQLKALKAAGFHHEVNVIAQFDPFTEGTPTHIFDVNLINKKLTQKDKKPNIGFTGEADLLVVPNLIEDKLWADEKAEAEKDEDGKEIRAAQDIRELLREVMKTKHKNKFDYDPPKPPNLNGNSVNDPSASAVAAFMSAMSQFIDSNGMPQRPYRHRRREPEPFVSLYKFLKFCREEYPARHYMLFILGHGVVVGNDVFLYDEHAEQNSITLNEMGLVLKDFKKKLPSDSTFELIGFHSCSVSSLEVAYELQDTAKYMLASQAPTFVGSWPYRHMLMRIFKDVQPDGTSKNIRALIEDLFSYCLHNSKDFLLAGYSYQVTLCDLTRLSDLKGSLQKLTNALLNGMEDPASTFIILYSHWKAQSFFQEMYTDLPDFCYCVVDRYDRIQEARGAASISKKRESAASTLHVGERAAPSSALQQAQIASSIPTSQIVPSIPIASTSTAATSTAPAPTEQVVTPLDEIALACDEVRTKLEPSSGNFIVKSQFLGPAYQYSHGVSVYFPWSRPSADSDIMEQYSRYTFHKEFHEQRAGEPLRTSWRDFLDKYFDSTQRVPTGTELQWEARKKSSTRSEQKNVKPKTLEQKVNDDILSLIYNGEGPLGGSLNKTDPKDRTGGDCDCPSLKNYPRDTRARNIRRRQAKGMPAPTLLGDFEPQT